VTIALPNNIAQTVPDDEPTVTLPEVLLHVPPATASDSVIHEPAHTPVGPLMADGDANMVTGVVT
jgi:hypothetical protein